jgi:hypothetical protein
MQLPAHIGVAEFDALHGDTAAWRGLMESPAREHGVHDAAAVRQETASSELARARAVRCSRDGAR